MDGVRVFRLQLPGAASQIEAMQIALALVAVLLRIHVEPGVHVGVGDRLHEFVRGGAGERVGDVGSGVAAAAQRKYPKATVRLVNEITEGGSPVYDIALTVNKKPIIATFSSGGEFLSETEDEP